MHVPATSEGIGTAWRVKTRCLLLLLTHVINRNQLESQWFQGEGHRTLGICCCCCCCCCCSYITSSPQCRPSATETKETTWYSQEKDRMKPIDVQIEIEQGKEKKKNKRNKKQENTQEQTPQGNTQICRLGSSAGGVVYTSSRLSQRQHSNTRTPGLRCTPALLCLKVYTSDKCSACGAPRLVILIQPVPCHGRFFLINTQKAETPTRTSTITPGNSDPNKTITGTGI